MKITKTNAARLLDKAKIAYDLIPYEVDESDLSATHVADQLNESVEQLFKTLVLKGDKTGYFVYNHFWSGRVRPQEDGKSVR